MKVRNFMRVKLVELDLRGKHSLRIAGRNSQGKSSTLKAYWAACGGRDFPDDRIVRDGEDEAFVELKIGDGDETKLIVTRTWKANGTDRLVVSSPDGARFPSPQSKLSALHSTICYDPRAFNEMPEEKKAQIVRQLAGLDFADLDVQRKELYDARTEINREVTRLSGLLASTPEVEAPDEEVGIAALIEEQGRRIKASSAREQAGRDLDRAVKSAEDAAQRVSVLREQLLAAEESHQRCLVTQANLLTAYQAMPEVDLAEVSAQIEAAGQVNAAVAKKRQRAGIASDLETARCQSAKLTAGIDGLDRARAEMIAGASFPVPGLGFDAAGFLTFNGIPYSQSGDGEQTRVSTAIGFALNPEIKNVLIRQASLLDDDNLAIVVEMAAQVGGFALLEMVGGAEDGDVVIEDGFVVGAETVEQAG